MSFVARDWEEGDQVTSAELDRVENAVQDQSIELTAARGGYNTLDDRIADIISTGGGVTDHGALTGLDDDDHALYALADGTRGAFATPASVTAVAADLDTVEAEIVAARGTDPDLVTRLDGIDTTQAGVDVALESYELDLATNYSTTAAVTALINDHDTNGAAHAGAGFATFRMFDTANPAGVVYSPDVSVVFDNLDPPTGVKGDIFFGLPSA